MGWLPWRLGRPFRLAPPREIQRKIAPKRDPEVVPKTLGVLSPCVVMHVLRHVRYLLAAVVALMCSLLFIRHSLLHLPRYVLMSAFVETTRANTG